MKRIYLVLILILFSLANAFSQGISDIVISGDFQNKPLKEILNKIEKEHHIVFFYQEEWISDINVTKSFQDKPLIEVLEEMLNENGLSFIAFNPYTVFLINEAPEVIESFEISDTPEKFLAALDPEVVEEAENEKIVIGKAMDIVRRGNATLSGYIREAKNGEGIFGGTVYVEELKKGTVSNQYGFFSITLPTGNYHIAFSYLGFKKELKHIFLNSSGAFNIELSETPLQVAGVTITGEAEDLNVEGVQMSMTRLSIKTIESIPAFLGEVDVIKSLTLLPSVSTVGEGASGFNVRGGDIDQNLILLDDAPIFNSSHVFGFFSVFNSDAVKNVTLYAGGISAKYGGRLSVKDSRLGRGTTMVLVCPAGISLNSTN